MTYATRRRRRAHDLRRRSLRAVLLAGACAAGLGAGLGAVTPARADDATGTAAAPITAEGARMLEQQVHDWFAALLGSHADLGARPLHVTAEDDHYRVELPLAGTLAAIADAGVSIEGAPVSAELKPLDGGRWAIDDIRIPSPLHLSFPTPSADGGAGTSQLTATVEHQEQHAVLDPSLATPSHWDATIKGYASSLSGPADMGTRTTSVDEVTMHMRWEPVADGHLTVLQDSESHLLATNAVVPNVGLLSVSAERMRAEVRMDSLAPDEVAPLIHAVMDLGPVGLAAARQAGGEQDAPKLTDENRASVHAALSALAGLMGGFDERVTLENLHVVGSGHSGRLAKMVTGLSVGAPAGRAQIRFEMAFDGLDSPDIPPGVFRKYLPRHIAFSPRVGGVPAADLRDLLLRAADSNGDDPLLEVQATALLAKGPLTVGLDDVALDFGPATLKGKGEMRVSAVDQYEGEAHFSATGLDDLIKQANKTPDLAQAAPVLFMLKGMGRADGARTVWDITYRDGKLLVNGNDMSGMMPGK
jgi:hypothetical protein